MSRFQYSLECSEYNTLQTVLKRTYIHDPPLCGRQLVGRSLKPPLVGVVTVHVGCSNAVSCR